jgi:hypothetical protein
MLEIVTLIAFIFWSVREIFVLTKNKENMLKNGVNIKAYTVLWVALLFYTIPLLATLFHNHYSELKNILLVGAVLLTAPGITTGYIAKQTLYTSGTDIGAKSGEVAEHIMFGGFATLILSSSILILGF